MMSKPTIPCADWRIQTTVGAIFEELLEVMPLIATDLKNGVTQAQVAKAFVAVIVAHSSLGPGNKFQLLPGRPAHAEVADPRLTEIKAEWIGDLLMGDTANK
jgi:hypothetical protein